MIQKSIYKVWYILKEDFNYSAENIFNIAHIASNEKFHNKRLYNLWVDKRIEKRMIYNINFLYKIEEFLIKNGLFFNWIEYKEELIGIRVQPTDINLDGLLEDCMTLDEFSKNRYYMNIKN